jgi:hypothetical protein
MNSQKILGLFLLSFAILSTAVSFAQAAERERGLHRGHSQRRGNENSQAVTQVEIGTPVYSGNGCPQGTMRAVFAPDGLSFSLLFDQFVAEVADPSKGASDIIACNALIPMQIPAGMQMQITRVDLRGFAALPARAKGLLHSVFNFRGHSGDGNRMNLRYDFEGPMTENYELSSDVLSPGETESSPCGGSFHLQIANQLRLRSSKKGEAASLTLDSIDGAAEAVYFVSWQACSGR